MDEAWGRKLVRRVDVPIGMEGQDMPEGIIYPSKIFQVFPPNSLTSIASGPQIFRLKPTGIGTVERFRVLGFHGGRSRRQHRWPAFARAYHGALFISRLGQVVADPAGFLTGTVKIEERVLRGTGGG